MGRAPACPAAVYKAPKTCLLGDRRWHKGWNPQSSGSDLIEFPLQQDEPVRRGSCYAPCCLGKAQVGRQLIPKAALHRLLVPV